MSWLALILKFLKERSAPPAQETEVSTQSFEKSLKIVLKHEGGWADHPRDPGGATMKGITKRTYERFLGRPVTKTQLKNIPETHLRAIYKHNYWDKASCGDLPEGVDLIIFDLAVNSGPGRARKYLQRAVGAKVDGVIGPKTLDAVYAAPIPELINEISRLRDIFYRSQDIFDTFGKGWLRRLAHVTEEAHKMHKEE